MLFIEEKECRSQDTSVRRLFRSLLKKSQGFSLAGLMVAVGMMGGLSLGLTHIMKQIHQGKQEAESVQSQFQLQKEISLLLANKKHCSVSLAGDDPSSNPVTFKKANIDEPTEGLDVQLFTSNKAGNARNGNARFYPNRKFGKWMIESLKLQLDASTGSHTPNEENEDLGNVVVTIKRKIDKKEKRKTLKIPVQIKVSTAGGRNPDSTILECEGEGSSGLSNIAETSTGISVQNTVQIGRAPSYVCDGNAKGVIRFGSSPNPGLEYCSGTNWLQMHLTSILSDSATGVRVDGSVQVGASTKACSNSNEGALRYNTLDNKMEFCNATEWKVLGYSTPQCPSGQSWCPHSSCSDGKVWYPSRNNCECQPGHTFCGGSCVQRNCNSNQSWNSTNCRCVTQQNIQCTGGRIQQGNSCICPSGQTWNYSRLRCEGQQPNNRCTGGQIQQGNSCVCPSGQTWNSSRRRCETQSNNRCTGGRIQRGNSCVCPSGQTWNSLRRRCVSPPSPPSNIPCTGGRIQRGNSCVCPSGQTWNSSRRRCETQSNNRCTGGRIQRGNSCVCPSGQTWNSLRRRCVSPPSPPSNIPCTGGRIQRGNSCVCPSGQTWNSSRRRCETQSNNRCTGGQTWDSSRRRCVSPPSNIPCTGGRIQRGNS